MHDRARIHTRSIIDGRWTGAERKQREQSDTTAWRGGHFRQTWRFSDRPSGQAITRMQERRGEEELVFFAHRVRRDDASSCRLDGFCDSWTMACYRVFNYRRCACELVNDGDRVGQRETRSCTEGCLMVADDRLREQSRRLQTSSQTVFIPRGWIDGWGEKRRHPLIRREETSTLPGGTDDRGTYERERRDSARMLTMMIG
jgi:hypothetical protein